MAHIADLMVDLQDNVGLNNYIARELSPSPHQYSTAEATPTEEKERFTWRMHQPDTTQTARKYQLFPPKEKLSIVPVHKTSDGEATMAEKERSILGAALRLKPKESKSLVRRRKGSVNDLGPMTTVQEISMDSPTIPGRPPLHERSISAPGNHWRQHPFGENMISCISGPALDETAENGYSIEQGQASIPVTTTPLQSSSLPTSNLRSVSPIQPLSPRSLAPLIIPQSTSQPQRIVRKAVESNLRHGSSSPENPPEVPPKSARLMGDSPYVRASPFTPFSASTICLSASTAPTSVNNTPLSALPAGEGRSSPKPWNTSATGRSSPKPWTSNVTTGRSSPKPWTTPVSAGGRSSPRPSTAGATTVGRQSPKPTSTFTPLPSTNHTRNISEQSCPPTLNHQRSFPLSNPKSYGQAHGHRRTESEGGAQLSAGSIMDRGRPKKRSDGSPIKPLLKRSPSNPTLSSSTPREKSSEQKAFERLPAGLSPSEVSLTLPPTEIQSLHKQALGQASRFQVLPQKDVECLSRELRALDERCEYLRRTHRSLRAGRRNLHERICSYLRSPRTAKFSHEAMLKQEEALSELDGSIDDWVSKLEQADNRRTRVRQKLLEHVAAALIMKPEEGQEVLSASIFRPEGRSPGGRNTYEENTPPRSPVKTHSPERLPSVSEERSSQILATPKATPPSSTETTNSPPSATSTMARGGRDVESIRIYADSDVYALLADVEDEIHRMGELEEGEQEKEMERMRKNLEDERRQREAKMGNTIAAGQMLNAVTFEGMGARPELRRERSGGFGMV